MPHAARADGQSYERELLILYPRSAMIGFLKGRKAELKEASKKVAPKPT